MQAGGEVSTDRKSGQRRQKKWEAQAEKVGSTGGIRG